MSEEKKTSAKQLMNNLNVEDVQSVSAGGISVTFRDKVANEKQKWQLELEKARAAYNPLLFGNWNDRNMRK